MHVGDMKLDSCKTVEHSATKIEGLAQKLRKQAYGDHLTISMLQDTLSEIHREAGNTHTYLEMVEHQEVVNA